MCLITAIGVVRAVVMASDPRCPLGRNDTEECPRYTEHEHRAPMNLSFGVFDHLDTSGAPLRDLYEDRLKLIELYDRLGFYCYQVAEHHSTPLGMAPSPSVLMAAVSQRTRRINFGPLVYTLPLYHPIRLIEEICMLDQISGGRLQFGVGKGISPIEVAYYGLDPAKLGKMFVESFEVLMRGLQNRMLDFEGEFYRFWYASFMKLWLEHGTRPVGVVYPTEFDGEGADGRMICGSPQSVRDQLQAQIDQSGVNYVACRFAFGDLSFQEARRSAELFA